MRPVVRQGQRDRERRVPREHADLEAAARAHEARQQPHELPLLGGDLHAGVRMRGGFLPQLPQQVRLAQRHRQQVLVERIRERDRAIGHAEPLDILRFGIPGV